MKKQKIEWQEKCQSKIEDTFRRGGSDFLIYASVGGGKTYLSLRAARQIVKPRVLAVYTYTTALVKQWEREASAQGLKLFPLSGNGDLPYPEDWDGFISTYASMGMAPDLHQTFIGDGMVIFDEVHHMSDKETTAYGAAAKIAAKCASFRLHLSGTPIRSDSEKIPFLDYNDLGDGMWELDTKGENAYQYSYGQAVSDKRKGDDGKLRHVCSQVVFERIDGESTWSRNEVKHTGLISECGSGTQESADCLRAAISTDSGVENKLVDKMLFHADRKLEKLRKARRGKSTPGGVVVCKDISHAKSVARILEGIAGEKPCVVVNEDDEASSKIDSFKNSDSKWIVAVKMVSEGVDIPRLMVGVYLSNIQSELFWWQFLGRIVRSGQPSFLYILKLKDMCEWATLVEEEVAACLKEKENKERKKRDPIDQVESDFVALGANGKLCDPILAGEEEDDLFLDHVYGEMKEGGLFRDDIKLSEAVRRLKAIIADNGSSHAHDDEIPETSFAERYKSAKARSRDAVKKYAGRLGGSEDRYSEVYAAINKKLGLKPASVKKRTEKDYEAIIDVVNDWTARGVRI